MIKAVCYYRVSTGKREQDSSLPVQQEICRRVCEREGWEIVGEYSDRKTGQKLTRSGFRAAADVIRRGEATIIVAKNLSRFARTIEFATFLKNEIQASGNDMYMAEGNFDTRTAAGRFNLAVQLAALQFTVEQSGEMIREAKPIRRSQGYHPSYPPFGATADPDAPGVPVKHPDEWPVYEWILGQAAEGVSYLQIARELDRRAIPTRFGGTWTDQSVRRIIKNEFYVAPDLLHQCKIDKAIWDAAQCRNPRGRRPTSRHPYLLRGLVYNGYFTVTAPKHLAGGPAPMGTVPSADGKPRYVIRAQYRSEHHKVEPAGDCPGIRLAAADATWLDRVVVERLIERADTTKPGALLPRARAAADLAQQEGQANLAKATRAAELARKAEALAHRRLMRAVDNNLDTVLEELQEQLRARRGDVASADKEVQRQQAESIQRRNLDIVEAVKRIHLTRQLWEDQNLPELQCMLQAIVHRVIVYIYRMKGSYHKYAEVDVKWKPLLDLDNGASENHRVSRYDSICTQISDPRKKYNPPQLAARAGEEEEGVD